MGQSLALGGLALRGVVARVNQGVPQAQRQALRGDDQFVVGEEAAAVRAGQRPDADEFGVGGVIALGGVLQNQHLAERAGGDAFDDARAVRGEDFFLGDLLVFEEPAGRHGPGVAGGAEAGPEVLPLVREQAAQALVQPRIVEADGAELLLDPGVHARGAAVSTARKS